MSIAEKIMETFDNQGGTPISEPVRSHIMQALNNWETIITPQFIKDPSKRFKSVARFYRNALAIESSENEKIDGKLLGCSRFTFYDTSKWNSENEIERKEERYYTLENNNNKFSEFSGLSIGSKFWTDYQVEDSTIKNAIDLLDTYINGVLYKLRLESDDRESIKNIPHIDRAHKKIFMSTINGRDPEVINGIPERTTFKKEVIDTIKDLYIEHMENKVRDVMLKFQKTLSSDARMVFQHNPADAKVINYNRFMGFKGGEKDIEVGMCLRDVNKYFPWALDFMGDLDSKLAADVIKEKNNIPDDVIGTERGEKLVKAIIKKHIRNAIKKEFNLDEKDNHIVDFIEVCNTDGYKGIDSIKEMSRNITKDVEAKSLFLDIAHSLSAEITRATYEARSQNVDMNEIMSPQRINAFNIFRGLKKNLVSMGIPSSNISLPDKISELDIFIGGGLEQKLEQESGTGNLSMFAHDLMRNVISVAMGRERRSMTTSDVFRTFYGDNIDLFDMSKSLIKNSFVRLRKPYIEVDGKRVMDSDIFSMGDVADVPLPTVGNLNHRYIFGTEGQYIIEFPRTARDFYQSMTQEQYIDGERITVEVGGDLRKMIPVLGQRVISQNTFAMVPDNKEMKKSYIVKQRVSGDIGFRTVAYVEVSLDTLMDSPSKVKPTLSIVDKTVALPSIVEDSIKHINTLDGLRVNRDALLKSYRDNLEEIEENRPEKGFVVPEYISDGITYNSIYDWAGKSNLFGIDFKNNGDDINTKEMSETIVSNFREIKKRASEIHKAELKHKETEVEQTTPSPEI